MNSRSHLNKLQLLCLTGLILALIGLMTPAMVLALPPRTTPPPTEKKTDKGKEKDRPIGAYIELQAATLPPGGWSVVQWQDSAGGWRDVEGWRGPLPGNTRWWVAAKDFGRGPFRWAVTQGPGGSQLSTSTPFNLPTQANQIVWVQLSP